MEKHTVYVLQETLEAAQNLASDLEKGGLKVVGASQDGAETLGEIERLAPEFLVTGLMCYSLDGLEVVKRLRGGFTKVLVVSAINREEIVRETMEAGAYYYMIKPVESDVIVERVNDLCGERRGFGSCRQNAVDGRSLDEKISKIFISVGIPPHIRGYSYLREGVKMAVKRPSIINNITKELYPGIGEVYSTSASKVERAIRHAIEVAWNRGRTECINSVFGVRSYVSSEKPTNGEFIALVADKMILEGAM